MKYNELYEIGKNKLKAAGIEEYELDARLLLESVCTTKRHDLLVNGEREVTTGQEQDYVNHILKRGNHVPLQYILGEQEFMGLNFTVTPAALIPRQDTETLVEEVKRHLYDGMTILDMCTGTGCILLSLLYYSNNCQGTGVDISAEALKIAARNEERITSLPRNAPPIKKVNWIESDLFAKVSGRFDIIVANPPYIPTKTIDELMPEVRQYEPLLALDGKKDGLYFYRKIIDRASQHLNKGGMLFLEIGFDQAEVVANMTAEKGFYDTNVIKDLAGNDRVVCSLL
ncbi:MAG: peptide chain release factor N(5)-glutamine methyltransferase [Lachnospiraceae bacterium]|nr:peptide chain release factor N(5)-glutamine methyltransferase [Lachnospiraceae bacterium]